MLELLKSLGFALLMVPVVMVLIMGIIYGLGEVFNLISPSQPKADRKS
ncbi:AcrZ family multidrug efflux pump-associated protein [Proteus columbae]|nr:AcrZ family multidrug efflux pump-associated protein [Proteus columbae]